MNQHKTRVLSWLLVLVLCAAWMSGCINLKEGDFYTTPSDIESTPTDTLEDTTPQVTIPSVTTTEEAPSEDTTPDYTTSSTPDESTEQTSPEDTTPPETSTEEVPPETTTEDPETPPTPDKKIKIYIDQGHNPFSPTHPPSWNTGASNESLGLYEQDLTYKIGILLAELLAQDDRFEVRLSRPTADTILGEYNGSVSEANDAALDFRVNDAAKWGADYFISLHTNSYGDSSVRGLEVYTANWDDIGYDLGNDILNALAKSTELRNRGMRDGSHLRVLKGAKMPAVLVEMGYISNVDDATLLDQSPELFAQGIYNGIQSYFDALESTETPEE